MKMKKLLLVLSLVSFVFSTTNAFCNDVNNLYFDNGKLLKSLGIIKESNFIIDIGSLFLTGAAAGGVHGSAKYLVGKMFGRQTLIAESRIVFSGAASILGSSITVTIGGVAAALFFPTSAEAGTLTEFYRTPHGFNEFMKLSQEQQISFLSSDPDLRELVERIAEEIEQTSLTVR